MCFVTVVCSSRVALSSASRGLKPSSLVRPDTVAAPASQAFPFERFLDSILPVLKSDVPGLLHMDRHIGAFFCCRKD